MTEIFINGQKLAELTASGPFVREPLFSEDGKYLGTKWTIEGIAFEEPSEIKIANRWQA